MWIVLKQWTFDYLSWKGNEMHLYILASVFFHHLCTHSVSPPPSSYFKILKMSPVRNVLPFWKQFEVNIKLMFNMAVLSPCFTFQCVNNMVVWVIYYSLEHVHAVFVVWISFAGNWGGDWLVQSHNGSA